MTQKNEEGDGELVPIPKDDEVSEIMDEFGENGEKDESDKNSKNKTKSPLDQYLPQKGSKAAIKEAIGFFLTDKLLNRLVRFKEEARNLIEEFQKYEDYFAGRNYNSVFLKHNLMKPVVRFRGGLDANVDFFYTAYYDTIKRLRKHHPKLKEKLNEILNPKRNIIRKLLILKEKDKKEFVADQEQNDLSIIFDKEPAIKKLLRKYQDVEELIANSKGLTELCQPNPMHVLILQKELGFADSALDFASEILPRLKAFTSEYRRFELPFSQSASIAKQFHRTLMKILGLGRQIEILFTERFGKMLMNHPELREDYAKAEYNTLLILRNLIVSTSIILMDPQNFSTAYREIQSRLYLIYGDADAIINKMLSGLTPEPNANVMLKVAKEIVKNLENMDKGEKKKRGKTNSETISQ